MHGGVGDGKPEMTPCLAAKEMTVCLDGQGDARRSGSMHGGAGDA